MPLNVALVPAPDQVVIRFTGDADLSTLPVITEALGHGASLGSRHVVVDVASMQFWDCSGLTALATFTGELAGDGRSCRIVGALPQTRRLIRLAHLTDRLVLDGAIPAAAPRWVPARPGTPGRRAAGGRPLPAREPAPVGAGGRPRRG